MTVVFAYRDASAADFAFLQRLHRAGMKSHVAQIWGWDEEAQERLLRERFDPKLLSVIRCGGEDVGILQVTRSPGAIRLEQILIDPTHQRRGIGTAILGALVAEAAAGGASLSLSVLEPNPAKALYERVGFVVVGTDDIRYEMVYRRVENSNRNTIGNG
jgi:ribosomal protein S18 acetylase RimI-like enzyme